MYFGASSFLSWMNGLQGEEEEKKNPSSDRVGLGQEFFSPFIWVLVL